MPRSKSRKGNGKILATLWGYPIGEDLDEDEMEELEAEHRAWEILLERKRLKELEKAERAEQRRLETLREKAYNDYFETIRASRLVNDRGVAYAPAFNTIVNHYLFNGLTQEELDATRSKAEKDVTDYLNKQEDYAKSGQGRNGDVLVAPSGEPPPPPKKPTNEIEPEQYSKEQILRALATTNDYLEDELDAIDKSEPKLDTKEESYDYFKGLIDGSYAGRYSANEVTDLKNTLRYITNFLVPIPSFTNNPSVNLTKMTRWMSAAQAKIFRADLALAGSGKNDTYYSIIKSFGKSEPDADALAQSAEKTAERAMLSKPERLELKTEAEKRAERLAQSERIEEQRLATVREAKKPTITPRTAIERGQDIYDYTLFNLMGADAVSKVRRQREETKKAKAIADTLAALLAQDLKTVDDDYIANEIGVLSDNPQFQPFVRKLIQEKDRRAQKAYKERIRGLKEGTTVMKSKLKIPTFGQGHYRGCGAARFSEPCYFPG